MLLKLYLDSSVVVKRYVTEPGSGAVDDVFSSANAGKVRIATSLWNFGEVLGVLDERLQRKWLTEGEFNRSLRNFASETVKLIRLRILEIVPVFTPILMETWALILDKHIYEADALQIGSCKYLGGDVLLSGDYKLVTIASKLGLKALDVKDEDKVRGLLSGS